MKKKTVLKRIQSLLLVLMLSVNIVACGGANATTNQKENEVNLSGGTFDYASVPEYNGEPYVEVNGNVPYFTEEEITDKSFETYGELDSLGRCTTSIASLSKDTMPKEQEKRGKIGNVKPTGWHSVKYDCVQGKFILNRAHCIGWQLGAENDNEKNLVSGTRYMNLEMLEYENLVADYIKETEHHVRYRVTPIYEGDNLVASGVEMEAESVEDEGEGLSFHVYVYNVQPGIEIDYATGDSHEKDTEQTNKASDNQVESYVLNTNNKKFHKPTCSSVKDMKGKNKET